MNAHQAGVEYPYEGVAIYEGIHTLLEQIEELITHGGLSNADIVKHFYQECIHLTGNAIEAESDRFYLHSLQQVQGILAWHTRIINEKKQTVDSCATSNTFGQQYTMYACLDDCESKSSNYESNTTDTTQMDIGETFAVCSNPSNFKPGIDSQGQDDLLKSLLRHPSPKNGLESVAGLHEAKRLLNQAIILPLKYPQLFKGARRPWKRILLYGPPGTGKTRLAHAVAGEAKLPFYCISSADLFSSWVGESEKLVRDIFRKISLAASKSIIFIDEIDGICRKRNSKEEDHCRRMKTELLRQIEENNSDECPNNVILLGATNCPWDLDVAFLRRFQRRIYIPLPDRVARKTIIKMHLMDESEVNNASFSELDWDRLVDATDGYSGSDLANLTTSALLEPIRDLQEAQFWLETSNGKMIPCPENHPGAISCKLQDIDIEKVTSREVTILDFMKGLDNTRCTNIKDDMSKYEEFTKKLGLTG